MMVQMREELAANQALLQDQEKTWEERLQEAEKVRGPKRQREALGERAEMRSKLSVLARLQRRRDRERRRGKNLCLLDYIYKSQPTFQVCT